METACHREAEELHLFFEEWMTGACDESDFDRCEKVLAKDFEIVRPSGDLLKRHDLFDLLRDVYGRHASLEIKIKDFRARVVGEGFLLATYEEWHTSDDGKRGRLSSALFRARADAPNGVEWVHVHETWLPE